MKKHLQALITMSVTVAGLVACAPQPGQSTAGQFGANKTTAGTILGGIGGAAIGSQFGAGSGKVAAVAAGTLAGAFLGNAVGTSLDRADETAMQQASVKATTAPVGQPITWNNPQSGHSGTVTTTRDGTDSSGRYCREYQQTVVIDGKTEQGHGTACREPDGSWQIVK